MNILQKCWYQSRSTKGR